MSIPNQVKRCRFKAQTAKLLFAIEEKELKTAYKVSWKSAHDVLAGVPKPGLNRGI